MNARPLPWTDLVAALGEQRLQQIRDGLAQSRIDDLDRDAFLLSSPVGQLLREMMPDEAPAETVNAYGALIHMLYVAWVRDWPVVPVSGEQLRQRMTSALPLSHSPTLPLVCYLQLPERLVWAEPALGEAHEPLDGLFLIATGEGAHALAILGFRTARDGFTTMEGAIALPAPPPPPRADGTAPFASTLPAGDRAGLYSVTDAHELVALALMGVDQA